jgi:hypothetical protein
MVAAALWKDGLTAQNGAVLNKLRLPRLEPLERLRTASTISSASPGPTSRRRSIATSPNSPRLRRKPSIRGARCNRRAQLASLVRREVERFDGRRTGLADDRPSTLQSEADYKHKADALLGAHERIERMMIDTLRRVAGILVTDSAEGHDALCRVCLREFSKPSGVTSVRAMSSDFGPVTYTKDGAET